MVEKTKSGQSINKFVNQTLGGTLKAGQQAIAAGYPDLATYTKQYLSGIPGLKKYGTPEQKQALNRAGQLYKEYADAGRYQKTKFGDIERMYGTAGQYDPAQYSRSDYTTPNIQERMSPYEELVSQRAAARLKKGYDEARGEREAQAVRAGAFGGSGAAIQEEVARRNYLEQMADMNAQNLQSAYESAVNLYGKERADNMSAEQLEEASRQFGKQTQLAGLEGVMAARQQTAGQIAAAKEAELAGLQGQQEAVRQQALLAEQRKNMRITDLNALQQGGQYLQDYNLQQRMYPLDVYARQSGIMGGMSGGYQPNLTTRESDPSTFQNILGGAGAIAGLAQGIGSMFRDGGMVYRGGGLADMEPEYYDRYER
jgi:hypothetical protein